MTSETHIYLGFGLTLERQSLKQCEKLNLPAISTHKNTRQQADNLLVGTFLTH